VSTPSVAGGVFVIHDKTPRVPFSVTLFFFSRGGLPATQRSYHHADEIRRVSRHARKGTQEHHGQRTCKVPGVLQCGVPVSRRSNGQRRGTVRARAVIQVSRQCISPRVGESARDPSLSPSTRSPRDVLISASSLSLALPRPAGLQMFRRQEDLQDPSSAQDLGTLSRRTPAV